MYEVETVGVPSGGLESNEMISLDAFLTLLLEAIETFLQNEIFIL